MASNVDDATPTQGANVTDSEETGDIEQVSEELKGASLANEFSKQTWKEDLVLKVEGRRLFVAGSVLGLVSPVFAEKLDALFKDPGKMPRELELPRHRYDDMVEFLRCVYPSIMKDVNLQNVMVVLPLSDEYGVELLKKRCEEFLVGTAHTIKGENQLCKFINLACRYGLDSLNNVCEGLVMKTKWSAIVSAKEYAAIPLERKVKLQNERINDVTTRLDQSTARCSMLENISRSFWLGASKQADMPEAEIGILSLNIPADTYMTSFESKRVCLNGNTCYLLLTLHPEIMYEYKYQSKNDVSIKVEPLKHLHQWSCQVKMRLRLPNHPSVEDQTSQELDVTLTESKSAQIIYSEYAARQTTRHGKLRNNIEIEAFLLVDSAVHKTKLQ